MYEVSSKGLESYRIRVRYFLGVACLYELVKSSQTFSLNLGIYGTLKLRYPYHKRAILNSRPTNPPTIRTEIQDFTSSHPRIVRRINHPLLRKDLSSILTHTIWRQALKISRRMMGTIRRKKLTFPVCTKVPLLEGLTD